MNVVILLRISLTNGDGIRKTPPLVRVVASHCLIRKVLLPKYTVTLRRIHSSFSPSTLTHNLENQACTVDDTWKLSTIWLLTSSLDSPTSISHGFAEAEDLFCSVSMDLLRSTHHCDAFRLNLLATLTPLALVGWLGRAWDTHLDTATDTHPDSTGLGWVDGTGLGHLDTRLDTVDDKLPYATGLGWVDGTGLGQQPATRHTSPQTSNSDWPRLGGWDGPGTTTPTYDTHSATTLLAPRLGGWVGPGSSATHSLDKYNTDSHGSGLMVGWLGWAWKTHIFICSRLTQQRDNISGPMVGWMGWARDDNTHTRQYNTDSNGSGLMVGSNKNSATTFLAMVGWLGRAWVIDAHSTTQHCNHSSSQLRDLADSAQDSYMGLASWLGGWDGPGRPYERHCDIRHSERYAQSLIYYRHIWPTHTFLLLDFLDKDSNESGLMVGWLGWAWKSIYTYSGLTQGLSLTPSLLQTSTTNQALVGWQGWAWLVDSRSSSSSDPALERTKTWFVGRDGLGHVSDSVVGHPANQAPVWLAAKIRLGHRIQHPSHMDQASVGRLGRAWDIGYAKVRNLGSRPGWVDGTGLGYTLTLTAQGFTAVVNQALVGWLGRAWDIGHGKGVGNCEDDLVLYLQFWSMDAGPTDCTVLLYDKPSPGWVDGMGLGSEFTTAVNQASVGRLGWAWDTGLNIHYTGSPLQ
ncbi:hypothetical protein ASPBRDRAFT_661388 [Aspergillus brasiliensis CBS 101740]|uniref:Uncharacterized protein n=1 Tax=Aspergillus brasiliensis (strain CBS 101740 / IMI 381727 / IBT 21946) TaxID=767769 RepID=A0A1L9U726_ASPBC|nr:hypothetical protein ASPBRDRAFT_661388 [Aspergillus brasiliensis CBS 101740]